MKIMFWNVRNLSDCIVRPGVRGHGLSMEERIRFAVLPTLKRYEPDVFFILETGPDADYAIQVLGEIAYNIDKKLSLGDAAQESCIVGVKKEFNFSKIKLVGENRGALTGFRKGIEIENGDITLVVLHAPSPSYTLDTRLNVIANIIDIYGKKKNVFFFGDLNIENKDFFGFQQEMNNYGLFFAGPNENTSLRSFLTQLALQTKNDFALEPQLNRYDQVWHSEGDYQVETCVLVPQYSICYQKELGEVLKLCIIENVNNFLSDNFDGYDTRTTISNERFEEIEKNINEQLYVLKYFTDTYKQTLDLINLKGLYNIVVRHLNEISFQLKTLSEGKNVRAFEYVRLIVVSLNNYINYPAFKTNIGFLTTPEIEYYISDHLPVLFEIKRREQ